MKGHADISLRSSGNTSKLWIYADSTRFEQVMTILLSNALEASGTLLSPHKLVEVYIADHQENVKITVKDWGKGVPKSKEDKIFQAFHTTKETGMGVGLFIAQQMVETHFKGSLRLSQRSQPTTFIISLPTGGSITRSSDM